MEQIRENMFFVVTIVIVILCGLFYVSPIFSVRSWEAANRTQYENDQKLEKRLSAWLVKGTFVPNKSAVEAAKAYSDTYNEMYLGKTIDKTDKTEEMKIEGVKDLFKKMTIPTVLTGLEAAGQDRPEVFLNKYNNLVSALKQEPADSGIRTDSGTWSFWSWGGNPPDSKEQRERAAREYSLISDVVGLIEDKSLGVVALERIEVDPGTDKTEHFNPNTQQPWPRRGEYFDAIPFVMEVKVRFDKLPVLMSKLLTSPTPIYIDGISIMRLTEEERSKMDRQELAKGAVTNVTLKCSALNYREVAPTVATGGQNNPPGVPGRPPRNK